VARALASHASKAGKKVSFFMRKGADILSKWVGEAERQLRLLFEEAQKAQPSIIFFDEIDGLAPVRDTPYQFQFHGKTPHSLVCQLLRKEQPSITFFDEIVCLAPTRAEDCIGTGHCVNLSVPPPPHPHARSTPFHFPLCPLSSNCSSLSPASIRMTAWAWSEP